MRNAAGSPSTPLTPTLPQSLDLRVALTSENKRFEEVRLWLNHTVECEDKCGMRWKDKKSRRDSKHGPKLCWPRREHLLPPMLYMQKDPNAAPVGMLFRLGKAVGVIVDHDTAYKISGKKPTPFNAGFWKQKHVRYVRAGARK